MIRKMVCLTAILLLGLTTNAFGADWALWQGSVSDNYSDPDNWVSGTEGGIPLGHMPASDLDSCTGISRTFGGTYWPVLRDNPLGGDWDGISAHTNLFSMNEWSGQYGKFTIDGGLMYFQANAYMLIGRHTGDTADFIVEDGGVGTVISDVLYGPTRWLMIGDNGSSTNAGKGTFVQNGGAMYAQAMSVGVPDPGHEYLVEEPQGSGIFVTKYDASDPGSSATINDGAELYVGVGYGEASFGIGPDASMTINPGGYVEINSDRLWDSQYVQAKGALNIVADSSGSGTLIIPWVVSNAAELRAYFGYDSTAGNVNAIYNGGAGQFVFNLPGGIFTEITVIPEPATIALLGIGGLCLLRRKRS